MKNLFDQVSIKTSRMITRSYSTSFSLGIWCLDKKFRDPIYAIYGFVRLADEIVDTFHGFPKRQLLEQFTRDTYQAIDHGISLNPVLNAFQEVVHQYGIESSLINQFLHSMEMDLDDRTYSEDDYAEYILGSAEVVGLMCLRVFCEGNDQDYQNLKDPAMKLGSAFQKINFLRDVQADYQQLGRTYFPGVDLDQFDDQTKKEIERDIANDFYLGFQGIKALPKGARFGVYIAYMYYHQLFRRICGTPAHEILKSRIRIPNQRKYGLILSSYLRHSFNLL